MTPSEAATRAIARCLDLARLTDEPGRITRLFLSPAAREVQGIVQGWMQEAGLTVTQDAAGNLRGLREVPGTPTLVIGSHVDTVPDAGAYDGILGVTLALELAEALRGEVLPFSLMVAAFSEEEGVRFGRPFIGSRALAGTLDAGTLDGLHDANGITPRQAMRDFGLNPDELPQAALDPAQVVGYLEIHIEQGPVLEAADAPVGVVTTVSGQNRLELRFAGQAAHAGTTPMNARRDALAAAAEFILEAERFALARPPLVATVGQIAALPGAGNVIPGAVTLSLDVRHPEDAERKSALAALLEGANAIAARRNVTFTSTTALDQPSVPMHPDWRAGLHAGADALGISAPDLPSGAGHDAMVLAPLMPGAMLFVRSPGGLSHHPDEAVRPEDVEVAFRVALAFLRSLAHVSPLES